MIWLGLTGGVASGKTTVANFFRERGVPVVDADQLAHSALVINKSKVIEAFGPTVLDANGDINRKVLGSIVFNDKEKLKELEGIIHPYVQKKTKEKKSLFESAGHKLAIYDVPLLFESNLKDQFDKVAVVYVPETLSLKRLMVRNSLTQQEAQGRLDNQISIEEKKKQADIVIDNRGDLDELRAQVEKIFDELTK